MLIKGQPLNRNTLFGNPKSFSLEGRIFNTVCVIAFLAMVFEVPFNFYIGLYVPASLCIFGIFISVYLYYLSRVKRNSPLAIKLFCLACNLVFGVNYFFNSGIFGPNLLLFSLAFLLIVAIIPNKHYKFWISFNLITVFGVLFIEYLNPKLVPGAYNSEYSKAIDFGITYLVVVTLTYFAISYLKKNYDLERVAVDEKNRAIEEQKMELERLNAEKNKLFSIVTHDIRTPINSILGYLEVLANVQLEESERTKAKQLLLQITRDTSDMLTNVLSWSKTQMEGSHADLVKINVPEELEKGLAIERNIAGRKELNFVINSDPTLVVLADKNMFELVVRNLVNNAIKFTPTGGDIEVSAYRDGNRACISIKDNGLGIDERRRESLFKLKASSTYGTNNERGIGLGLLLCKEFIDIQGGEIWYENNGNRGSIFKIGFRLVD